MRTAREKHTLRWPYHDDYDNLCARLRESAMHSLSYRLYSCFDAHAHTDHSAGHNNVVDFVSSAIDSRI